MNDSTPLSKLANVRWHQASITRESRVALNGHKSVVLWFTGLSGAGKSTIAHAVEEKLYHMGCRTFVFDGDNVRHGLCADLGFSPKDREENIRRVGEMAKLFNEAGVIAITAFISPFRADRRRARKLVAEGDFIEVYCRCSLAVCEQRDVKGLYAKTRAGEIKEFTGISSPYEAPEHAELILDTDKLPLDECVNSVVDLLLSRGLLQTSDKKVGTLVEG